jgi:hypothetical protein
MQNAGLGLLFCGMGVPAARGHTGRDVKHGEGLAVRFGFFVPSD